MDGGLCAYFLLQLALMRAGCVAQHRKLQVHKLLINLTPHEPENEWCIQNDVWSQMYFLRSSMGCPNTSVSPTWRLPMAFTTHSGRSWAVRESPVLQKSLWWQQLSLRKFPSSPQITGTASTVFLCVFMKSCFPFSKSPPKDHGEVGWSPQEITAFPGAHSFPRSSAWLQTPLSPPHTDTSLPASWPAPAPLG